MAYYAWSPIKGGTAEKPVSIKRGESISRDKLGVSEADWQALIEAGAVRDKKFPAPEDYDGSVIDYLRDQLKEAQALSAVDEEEAASALASVNNPPEPAPAKESGSGDKK